MGIPSIAVTLKPFSRVGFGTHIDASNFIEVIPEQPGLEKILREFNPFAIIPGAEGGVRLADRLAVAITPHFCNDPEKSLNRVHKAFMQRALEEAGIPALKTLNTSSEKDVESWLEEHGMAGEPLIVKPPISAGSDKVFHIEPYMDWRPAFHRVLSEPCKVTGEVSKTVVIQEQAIGPEFAVGTVSANGNHYLAHLIRYNKTSSGDRKTVFDHVEFLPYHENEFGELFDYAQRALDALGIRWGAAHNEFILTSKGPRLIESGARMLGGPSIGFAREATGSSQLDKLVEAYLEGDVVSKTLNFKKTVVAVFLKSRAAGMVSNAEVFDELSNLPTMFSKHIWFKNGEVVQQTVDYLTSIGVVALSGNRQSIFRDYARIREMESALRFR